MKHKCSLCGVEMSYDAYKDAWWCPVDDFDIPGLSPVEPRGKKEE